MGIKHFHPVTPQSRSDKGVVLMFGRHSAGPGVVGPIVENWPQPMRAGPS